MKMRSPFFATVCLGLMTQAALADGDPAIGETIFLRCFSCHNAVHNINKAGPYLRGVVGRPVATADGFAYSKAMEAFAATGAVWDEATLDKFLKDRPEALVPGTTMTAPPVRSETERADLIAFLKSKSYRNP